MVCELYLAFDMNMIGFFAMFFMRGPTLNMLLFHNLGEIEIVIGILFSGVIQVHTVLILTKLHIFFLF